MHTFNFLLSLSLRTALINFLNAFRPRLFASKLVEMEAIARVQAFVLVQQILLESIVEHQYASKVAQMEGGVWPRTLVSAHQDTVVMIVAHPSVTKGSLSHFMTCLIGC